MLFFYTAVQLQHASSYILQRTIDFYGNGVVGPWLSVQVETAVELLAFGAGDGGQQLGRLERGQKVWQLMAVAEVERDGKQSGAEAKRREEKNGRRKTAKKNGSFESTSSVREKSPTHC